MQFIYAFLTGGLICVIGQLLIDKTGLTPARILTGYVLAGIVLGALGLYRPLLDFASEGAAVPLSGFGSLMAQGVRDALGRDGAAGIITGGVTVAAAGVTAAVFFSVCAALVSNSREK